MKVSYSWLRDYVDIAVPVEELAERLTLAGLEVKAIEHFGVPGAELPWDPGKIVVGELLAVRQHPNADRLVVADVEYGGAEREVIVTGAPSMLDFRGRSDLHLKVAFAIEGASIYDGHAKDWQITKLKRAKVRGVPSRAMVCSEKELGLSEEHEDIIYLPGDAPVGMPLADYLGDTVLEFDIKGPFAYLNSVIGVAREAAALLGVPLKRDVLEVLERHPAELMRAPDFIALAIEAPDLCPRYSAAFIQGVTVAPAPFWMQMRLHLAGMRPINNVVDVTNYVMLELGQPLHAFDYHLLRRRRGEDKPAIIVRRAEPGEQMRTLDGELRTFDEEMLLITDGGGAVAVAGVMGGLESEVTESTADILLESASFEFLNVRRTSRLLGLTTDASQRFGRRVDPELTVAAVARAAWLMAELSGGTVDPVIGDVYPGRQPQRVIELDPIRVTRLLGVDIPRDEMVRSLSALEFQVTAGDELGKMTVTVPSHRQDVSRHEDLVEEIGRIWGYDRFPTTLIRDELPHQRNNPRLEGDDRVRDILVGCGLDEVITYSLVDIEDEEMVWPPGTSLDRGQYLRVRNALSAERAYLRQTLLPSLLRTAGQNLRFVDRVNIFEIGAVYLPVEGQRLPDEPPRLAVVMTGPREERSWRAGQDRTMVDFYDLKGVVEALLARLGLVGAFEAGTHPALHPGRCTQVQVGDTSIGVMGELHPQVREAFGLPAQPVCALEFDRDGLMASWGTPIQVAPISVHPSVYEDLAVVVEEGVPAVRVRDLIAQAGGALLRSVVLFDVYRGEQVGAGQKSLAYRLTYQAEDRTLTDRRVAKVRSRIVHRLERELGATLRA